MTLSDTSLKNPVFAVMLSAALVVFGYLGYRDLGISQFPEIDFPVVNVTTYREAAAPETMEFDVTDVIEDAISSVEGVDYVQSQSLQGVSVVTVFFHLSRNLNVAAQDVQHAVAAAAQRLPTDIDPPIVSKVNFNKFPVIWLSVHGQRPIQEINRLVEDRLKHEVETIPGCGGVFYGGLRRRSMRIWLDGPELYKRNLDALDVFQALRLQHQEKPAGYLQGIRREHNVRTMGEAAAVDDFRRMPVLQKGEEIVRLEDVAVVEDGLDDYRGFARFNREPNVGLGVMRAIGANVVEVCDEVKRRIPHLRSKLPPDVTVSVSTDFSLFIKDDIDEVKQALLLGVLLTALVSLFFLGSLATTINVCLTIPVSLIGTFIVMKRFGFTLNFMTLLALSLSVGVVVDDAILVLENIYRRRQQGEGKRAAARNGANEIAFAATAATLAIAAIFIPVAFLRGAIGQFFFQFGIAVTVAVLLSLLVALTLTPVLCSIFLEIESVRPPRPPRYGGPLGLAVGAVAYVHWLLKRWLFIPLIIWPVEQIMRLLTWLYRQVLRWSLRHPGFVIPVSLLIAASALAFVLGLEVQLPSWIRPLVKRDAIVVKPLGRELVPSEDQSRFSISLICPVGSSIDLVDEKIRQAEARLVGMYDPVTGKEVIATFFAALSIRPGQLLSEGTMFVRLIPKSERSWTQAQVMNEVRRRFADILDVRTIVMDLSTQGFTPTRGYPVNFAVQGPEWSEVVRLAEAVRMRMAGSSFVTDVNSDYRPGMGEIHLYPLREKAAQLGVPIQRLGFAINIAMGGFRGGRFTDGDRRYDVRLRYQEQQRASPDQLDDFHVKTDRGQLVPLRDLVERRTISTLPVIPRLNHLRKVELSANMAPGVSQGEAISRTADLAETVRAELGLPATYRFVQLGNAKAMAQTIDSLWYALALGFVVAAMILGVQFNSFVHPFTVLTAVPFGMAGAVFTLWLLGDTLNLMSMIGLVLLAGLVKKNSIVLVDYTNQLRNDHEGRRALGLEEAVLTACPIRLRPILMTSLATIAGAVPMAIGWGAGAETRAPLARAIIGGIVVSTAITLIFVPVLYVVLDRFATWLRRLADRAPPPSMHPPSAHSEPRPRGSG
jgi:multidrug efflux pump subunit AcrB